MASNEDTIELDGNDLLNKKITIVRIPGPQGPQGAPGAQGPAGSGGTGSGDVTGPASSVSGGLVKFSGTTGKVVQGDTSTGIVKLTGGVVSTVTAPTGALVGTTDAQTLTNKSLDAASITSGTVSPARLGSGTADSTTFLRGDGTWQPVVGGSGTTIIVQEGDTNVDAAVSTLDFDSSAFNITSSPAGEANIAVNFGNTAGTVAQGDHNHDTVYATRGAKFILQQPDGNVPNAQSLSALSTGLLKVTTTTGVLSTAIASDLPTHTHAAADINSGTLATARLGSGTANSTTFLRGDSTWVTIPGGGDVVGPAASITNELAVFSGTTGKLLARATGSGFATLTAGVLSTTTAPTGAVVGTTDAQTLSNKTLTVPVIADFSSAQHAHTSAATGGTLSATAIGSGTFAAARLGSGTANSTTFLRGDLTWATPPGAGGSADGGPMVLTVAANNASASIKARADYVCTGTNDEVVINTALAALPTTGGKVQLSAGTFNIGASIWVLRDGTTLQGAGISDRASGTAGATGTLLQRTGSWTGAVVLVDHSSLGRPVFGATLRDFGIDGGYSGTNADGILFRSYQGYIHRVAVWRCLQAGIHMRGYTSAERGGLGNWDTYDSTITQVIVGKCYNNSDVNLATSGMGIWYDLNAPDTHLAVSILYDNYDNIRMEAASQQITNVHTYGGVRHNIYFNGSGSRTKITGCKIEGAGQHGVNIDTANGGYSDIQFVNNNFANNGRTVENTYDHLIIQQTVGTLSATRTLIVGNSFSFKTGAADAHARYGVNLTGAAAQDVLVVNNTFGSASHFGTSAMNIGGSATGIFYPNLNGPVQTAYAPAVHTHAAADITSGTVATARLGSGTANSTTFLRGDSTWSSISGAGLGDVTGPAASVDNDLVLFSGTSGKLLKRTALSGVPVLVSGTVGVIPAPVGALVGTTDNQVLSSKTLSTPTISSGVLTTGTAPTIAVGSGAGSTGTAVLISGNDLVGQIRIVPGGTGIIAGTMFTFTFAAPKSSSNYVVMLTPASAAARNRPDVGPTARTPTSWSFVSETAFTTGLTYQYQYNIIEYIAPTRRALVSWAEMTVPA